MASHSATGLSLQAQGHARTPASRPALPASAVLVILAILLILLSWLHLVLALQTISVGRQIQAASEDLAKAQRSMAALRCEVAQASAPGKMLQRAAVSGYTYQQPVFLPVAKTTSELMISHGPKSSQPEPSTVDAAPTESPVWEAAGRLLARLGMGSSQWR